MARNIYYWTMYVLCLTAYVTDSTFCTTVQGNIHMQFTLANQPFVTFVLFTNTYSLCHWQHILYNSSRQCTHAIYICNHSPLLHLFYLQILYYGHSYNYKQHITYGRKGIKSFSITEEEWHISWAYVRLNQANS